MPLLCERMDRVVGFRNHIQNGKEESKTVSGIDRSAKQDSNLILDFGYKVNYLTVAATTATAANDSKFVSCVMLDSMIKSWGMALVGERKDR
ncbi:unnamed protein product [Ambrosiozyma monospora]|uniref:Unnamed protein product n=1 Tax=Ambrosiozyma monospora TaxID=43982 RepID=A0A9W6YZY4_AMBMO|nr:unnamed protein product [Ambrosiozyma monospora]